MFTRISLARFDAYSVYKLLFIGLACSFIPLGVVFGIFAFFGADTVQWNGQPIHGVTGLLASLFIGAILAICFTAFAGAACAFGLWLFSKFRPFSLWGKNIEHYVENVA